MYLLLSDQNERLVFSNLDMKCSTICKYVVRKIFSMNFCRPRGRCEANMKPFVGDSVGQLRIKMEGIINVVWGICLATRSVTVCHLLLHISKISATGLKTLEKSVRRMKGKKKKKNLLFCSFRIFALLRSCANVIDNLLCLLWIS